MPGIKGEKLRYFVLYSMEKLNYEFFSDKCSYFIDTNDRADIWYAYIVPSDKLNMNFRILLKKKYTKRSNPAGYNLPKNILSPKCVSIQIILSDCRNKFQPYFDS